MRDLDIRKTLKATCLKKYYSDGHSRIVDELSLCRGNARIDLAVINGALHGFEIKSELDTLIRLPKQIETYLKVFDYMTVCAGLRHVNSISKLIPQCCGILVAETHSGIISIRTLRPARKNQTPDALSVAQLLWKEEVLQALGELGIAKGLSGKSKDYLWALLAEAASLKEVAAIVRQKLKVRSRWRLDQQPFESDDCSPPFSM